MCFTMPSFDYLDEDQGPTNVVGSFITDRNLEFKQGMKAMLEGFRNATQLDPVDDLVKILKVDTLRENYKNRLIGDVLQETAIMDDPYLSLMPEKLEQLFENTTMEILRESSVGQLAPIVGISLPVLKKNYLECHSKDIVMTEVPSKPIVKVAFERRFLKDKDGNKHYIPEIFYDDTYKNVIAEMTGKPINPAWYPQSGNLPFQDLDLLTESGGTMAGRDKLALDFVIDAVQIEVTGPAATPTPVLKTVANLGIIPDTGVNGGAGIGSFSYRVKTTDYQNNPVEEILTGQVDFYSGKISVTTTGGKIKKVKFGGHLSNENNVQTVDLDRERENITWQIPDGKRINTGLTIEKIKDYKALFSTDITTEIIADISTVLTQVEDSTCLDFLDVSLAKWKGKKELPFGYGDGFVESYKFSATPPVNVFVTPSQWIGSELKYFLNRELDELKTKLRTQDIMFVIYGHPNNITLIQDDVKWVIDEDTKIGGIQLDYRFGVMTTNKNRVHVVSSLKVNKNKGIRIVAYPLSKEVITFKHYKYSLNIENVYRNPFTPLTPNVMGTSRYLTTEVLPVQGEFIIENNDFGRQPL
jgi:hypothetical protein